MLQGRFFVRHRDVCTDALRRFQRTHRICQVAAGNLQGDVRGIEPDSFVRSVMDPWGLAVSDGIANHARERPGREPHHFLGTAGGKTSFTVARSSPCANRILAASPTFTFELSVQTAPDSDCAIA